MDRKLKQPEGLHIWRAQEYTNTTNTKATKQILKPSKIRTDT